MIQLPSIQEFDYFLPPGHIADFPLAERDVSKLLVYQKGTVHDDTFYHLHHHLPPGSTLVLNDTRVLEARILFQKSTGGYVEIFCLAPAKQLDPAMALSRTKMVQWECLLGGASKWKPGQELRKVVFIHKKPVLLSAFYESKLDERFQVRFEWSEEIPFSEMMQAAGVIPLPPYIKRKAADTDAERYQTVFAHHKGSVAAPTAALHFTENVFEKLRQCQILPQFITLHVGAGTFRPVKTNQVQDHTMHGETFMIRASTLKALAEADTLVAVGTTSLRTLESLHWMGVKLIKNGLLENLSLAQWEAYDLGTDHSFRDSCTALYEYMYRKKKEDLHCRTHLMIVPGYSFASARALITNFHQPRSTLLLLVAAFIGKDWKKVYDHALQHGYRFLSYGDSSLLWRD